MESIILEFPISNLEIDLGTVITFDNISGFLPIGRTIGKLPITRTEGDLPIDRLENVSSLMNAQDGHDVWNDA